MTIKARVPDSVTLSIGAVWPIEVRARDEWGWPTSDTVVVTVTRPDGVTTATPAVTEVATGWYRAEYVIPSAGRFVARAVGALGAADFTAYGVGVVFGAEVVDIDDLNLYLGSHSFTDEVLQAALDAEASAQRKTCRVPAAYPADLKEALCRRVARNLAMRRVPLSVLQGDADAGTTNAYPGRDPEVRRLEGPYRRLVMG